MLERSWGSREEDEGKPGCGRNSEQLYGLQRVWLGGGRKLAQQIADVGNGKDGKGTTASWE